jgi:hypothetical protein
MKKIIIMIIAFGGILATNAKAQIQQGNVMVGVNFASVDLQLNNPKFFSVSLSPKAAWFVKNNFALGGYADLGIATGQGSTSTSFGIGALSRYYTGQDVEVLHHGRFFGEAIFGVSDYNQSNGGNTGSFSFSFGPGFAYFITPNVGLETVLKYYGQNGFNYKAYQSNVGLSFGFQIYLPGKSAANKVKNDQTK